MQIFLVRHGETNWNKERRIQGRADIPLNEYGIYLAKETAKGLNHITFDRCYTSPLIRAVETANLLVAEKNIPIIVDNRIIEMSFGKFEGLSVIGEKHRAPESFKAFIQAPEKYQAPKDGESFEEVKRRTKSFIKELAAKKELADKNILVTTHGAALASILNTIKEEPLAKYWGKGVAKNCAVSTIEVTDGAFKILSEDVIYYKEETNVKRQKSII